MKDIKNKILSMTNSGDLLDLWSSYNTCKGDSKEIIQRNKSIIRKEWNKSFKGNLSKIKRDCIRRINLRTF